MSKQSFPIARGFAIPLPKGGYHVIGGIFAEAKSQEQREAINQELVDSIEVLFQTLKGHNTAEGMQTVLDNFCKSLEKNFGIICRGVVTTHFIGLKYKSNGKIYKEGISRE